MSTTHPCAACEGKGAMKFLFGTIVCYICDGTAVAPTPRLAATDFMPKPFLPKDMRDLITTPVPETTPEEEEEFKRILLATPKGTSGGASEATMSGSPKSPA